jgi:26 proteasome complex subunit DSS1
MSAAPAPEDAPTAKAITSDKSVEPSKDVRRAAAPLEEDDEFEDFPVESMLPIACLSRRAEPVARRMLEETDTDGGVTADWTQEDTEVPGDNTHLWEESWDDDDTTEDFSAQLK